MSGFPADEAQAEWPEWFQRVEDPDGGAWRVRSVDLLRAPGQFAPAEARAVVENMGRFVTTVEWPDGGQRTVYTEDEEQAEEYHRRVVQRIRAGQL